MKKFSKNQKGFTLIEVIASITIITIVLLSFSQIFIQSNRTAAVNNEKLVTVNLADAMLAKARAKTYTKRQNTPVQEYFIDRTKTDKKLMNPPLEVTINGRTYSVNYEASQSTTKPNKANYSEADLNLVKVIVTVTAPDGKTKGSSEGYVTIE